MKKILIVDDQPLYLRSLEMALKRKYQVSSALSYAQAIDILQDDIEIALVDVRLQEDDEHNTDGLKILEWIMKNKPNIPVCMISAYQTFEYAQNALNMGAKHFFRKPIDVEELLSILEEKS